MVEITGYVPQVALREILTALFFPPGGLLLAAMLALALAGRWPRAMRWAALGLLLCAWLVSTQAIGTALAAWVEGDLRGVGPEQVAAIMAAPDAPQAVVVLGGGARREPREWNGPDVLKVATQRRLQQGMRVARWSGLPILLSGGAPSGDMTTEAALMARELQDDYGMRAQWIEPRSRDTRENARESTAILMNAGVRRVFLVTDSLHLPRAERIFQLYGMAVVPVPAAFSGAGWKRTGAAWVLSWMPSPEGIALTSASLHETVGKLWYEWTTASGRPLQ